MVKLKKQVELMVVTPREEMAELVEIKRGEIEGEDN